MTLTLTAESRDSKTNLDQLRAQGKVPAVFYGSQADTTSITIDEMAFRKVYREAGESTVITLKTDAGDVEVLVQDYQLHPVKDQVLHVDFKAIVAGEAVTVNVSLEFTGEAPVEKSGQGTINTVLQEIEIEALPKDLPSHLEVDISSIENVSDHILAKDITLPAGVTLVTDPNEPVVVASGIREETDDEGSTEIDFDSIQASGEKAKEEPSDEE